MPEPGERIIQQLGPPPPAFGRGSQLEYLVFYLLQQRGLVPGLDFLHQYYIGGGRLVQGGLVPDFFFEQERTVWLIQGLYYHYRLYSQEAQTITQVATYIGLNYHVVVLDEDRLLATPHFIIDQALAGISHSRIRIN